MKDYNQIRFFTGILATRYLQKITSRLLLGAELFCLYGPGVSEEDFTYLSVASKLTGMFFFLKNIFYTLTVR